MRESFYFYDLETSGLDARGDRIMQFAGQRTDLDFRPIGDPDNILIRLADDTLPGPFAVMVTGITPQSTLQDGLPEHEFCRFFIKEIATPGTTLAGYNSVRFDDEFMRYTLWRNFYDPYEWQWSEGRSRWDLLDVVRMTRALRPEGINWPVTSEGRATNRLELITKSNNISHEHAHDALSDVEALISVTKLIKDAQPQLFEFLYSLRGKHAVAKLVDPANPRPFVYSSGRYPSETGHTTVVVPIAEADNGSVLVYDLRYNLEALLQGEATAKQNGTFDKKKPYSKREPWERDFFPIVKKLRLNRCPAVAPLGVLGKDDGWSKIQLTEDQITQNLASLKKHPEFVERMQKTVRPDFNRAYDPESALYDGFLNDADKRLCAVVRGNTAEDLADFHPPFVDERLDDLLLHYKAKSYPASLSDEEAQKWEEYRRTRLERQAPKFLEEIQKVQEALAKGGTWGSRSPEDCAYLLEELHLWYESLQPGDY